MSLGDNIKKIRQSRGLSLQELVKLSGVAKSTIHDAETGRVSPNTNTLEKLAKALDVPVSYLLDEDSFINKSAEEIREEYKALIPKIEKLSKEDKDFIKQMIDRLGGE